MALNTVIQAFGLLMLGASLFALGGVAALGPNAPTKVGFRWIIGFTTFLSLSTIAQIVLRLNS